MSDKTIIVIYNKANTLNLPYSVGEGKKRSVKFLKLVPGKNTVKESVWKLVCAEAGEERMANHSRYIKVPEVSIDEAGKLDFDSLINGAEMIEFVENIMSLDELKEAKDYEEGRSSPRKTVLIAIEKQVKSIQSMINEIEKSKENE